MKKNIRLFGLYFTGIVFLGSIMMTSCKKDSSSNNDNGKVDPSTIASADLVAYFPFDNNGNDAIGGMTPKASPGVTYVTGKRGQAYQGADGAYFLYDLPTASKLKDLKAFTISMWFYGTPAINGTDPVPGILQISGTSDPTWGNLMLTQDRMDDAVDSLNIKIVFHKEGVAWANQFVGFSKPEFIENKWMHIVFDYDNVSSKYMVYVNGAPLTLDAGITDRWADSDQVNPRPALGDLSFADAAQFAIGCWMQKIVGASTDAWMGYFTGKMDELRIYDRGLTADEVKSLYDAEVSQLTE